jgi:DNA-binding PadR family transcriptional regulator
MFNEKKLRVLGLLARNGPMTPPEIAARLGLYPVRAMYSYMLHLAKWSLVTRERKFRRGRMLYSLTAKGRARLAWLNRGTKSPSQ